MNLSQLFDKFSRKVTKITGSHWAFIVACLTIIIWAISGFHFDFSETWQLVINTGTTIITFLMVFIIQQSSNKDTASIHIKLNELIKASEKIENKYAGIEEKTDAEIKKLKEENY